MERHFTLPVTFAAAFHGALLFAFWHGPSRLPAIKPPEFIKEYKPIWLPPEPPMVDSAKDPGPKAKVEVDVPRSEERPHLPPTEKEFTEVPPPRPSVHLVGPVMTIPEDRGGADGLPRGSIIPSGLLDKPPHTRYQAAPVYPVSAKSSGITGQVTVEFTVDESGRVLDPRVVNSTNTLFDEATLRAVAKWRFDPGRRNGTIVRFRMAVPVVYRLGEE